MSKYVRYYMSKQKQYLDFAQQWSKWSETAELSEAETAGISKFFGSIAKRFGLIQEFRDLGVIQ